MEFEHGFVTTRSDEVRLYVLVDVLADTEDDTEDGFWITFDVDRDGEITPGIDLNYRLEPETRNMRYQYYLGPGEWTELQSNTRSSMAAGFGCFLADDSQAVQPPPDVECSRHRIWEFAIDLDEIDVQPGGNAGMGLRIFSGSPSFMDILPADFSTDFYDLIQVEVARPVKAKPTGDPNASIGLQAHAIEVTQAIQNRQNSLQLVKDKKTVARVYVQVTGVNAPQPALVYLYGKRDGADLPGSPLSGIFTVPTTVNREQLNDVPFFLLPTGWVSGSVEFRAEVRDVFGVKVSSSPITLEFKPRAVPHIWIVPINTGSATSPTVATNAEIARSENYLKTIYPVPDVKFVRKSWKVIGATTLTQAKSKVKDYYSQVFLAWIFGSLFTGQEPFTLPDQVFGYTPSNTDVATSDPVWASNGRGYVAIGGPMALGRDDERVMAHEINHNLDRSTTGSWGLHVGNPNPSTWGASNPNQDLNWGCGASGTDASFWPWTNDNIQEVGFDPSRPAVDGTGNRDTVIPANYPDLMSYCSSGDLAGNPVNQIPPSWISTYRWTSLFNRFSTTTSSLLSLANGTRLFQNQIQTVYFVSGRVHKDGTGSLDPVLIQPGIPTDPAGIVPGEYVLEVLDAAERPLLTLSFRIAFEDIEGRAVETVDFDFQLPEQEGTAKIILKRGAQALATVAVSANAPTVTVLAPNGGEEWAGTQTIRWLASDEDGDDLSFTIFYTPDDGRSWFPVASGVQGNAYAVDTSSLPGGDAARVRVIATDGFHTSQDDSDGTFVAARNPPEAYITLPQADTSFSSGEIILFEGDATDLEDDMILDTSLVWSYGSTVFATGRQVAAVLPDGVHVVILTAVDSEGNTSQDAVEIFVNNVNHVFLPLIMH